MRSSTTSAGTFGSFRLFSFVMSALWNPIPYPQRLDDRRRHTLYGVGLIMSGWESLEFELARIYSFFAEDPDGLSVQTEYGKGRIFSERLLILREKACSFFIRWPHQDVEGLFDQLTERAEELALQRNDVAHGIVYDVSRMVIFSERYPETFGRKPGYALIPPLYTLRRHQDGLPTYAYALPELKALARELGELGTDIQSFREALAGLVAEWLAERP